jgi:serine/threonine-protein kinase
LHRDFKSDNDMLRAEGGDESSPLILDFGLARALDQRHASSSNPTLVGTFGYIAPEQLEGKPYSTASDVYALGIVWFEMLTGELPFESSSSPAVAALERLQREAPPPSSKNPEVPSDLDAIVQGCLRRSLKDRFRTPAEVLAALDKLEAQKRSRFQERRLLPILFALGFACFAAYAAFNARPDKPAVTAVKSLDPALPTPPSAAEHALSANKAQPRVAEPSVIAASAATATSKPRAGPEPNAPHAPPTRSPSNSKAAGSDKTPLAASDTAKPPLPQADSPPPVGAVPTPMPPTPQASKQPGWEDPFGASNPVELVNAKHN